MKAMTRREFIAGTAATGAAICLGGLATAGRAQAGGGMGGGGMGGGGMGGGGTGVTIIDPPVGAAAPPAVPFSPTRSSDSGVYEVSVDRDAGADRRTCERHRPRTC